MNWGTLISSAVSIITGIAVIATVLKKFKGILKEIAELFLVIYEALGKESEGGEKITATELERIIEEAKDIGEAIAEIRNK